MKKILVVLMLLITISVFADWKEDLKKEGIDPRLAVHAMAGFGAYFGAFVTTSNIKFTQEYAEVWSFYITSAIIVTEELHSNNWEGVKFWKLTSSVLGMKGGMLLLDGKRPIIYANYNPKTKAVGIDFAFNFDLPTLNKEKGSKR